MKNNSKKLLCAALTTAMLFSLAGCGSSSTTSAEPAKEETAEAETPAEETAEAETPAEETAEAETPAAETPETETPAAETPDTETPAAETPAAETADATYTNKGFTLTIPAKYDGQLFTTTPEEENVLFKCSEIASIDAANKKEMDLDRVGYLFSIETIDEATLNDSLCGEMSGSEAFATDGNGTYFLFCHPTDLTIVREGDISDADLALWNELSDWAKTIPDTFVSNNSQLTAEKYGNTDLDIYLSRIAFVKDTKYILSTLEFLELEPKDVDPTPYLEKLRKNATYEPVEGGGPDGEYVVLSFPDDHIRFEFPANTEDGCYVRQIWGENEEWKQVYKASFADSSINSTQVMQEWYDALAVANGKK